MKLRSALFIRFFLMTFTTLILLFIFLSIVGSKLVEFGALEQVDTANRLKQSQIEFLFNSQFNEFSLLLENAHLLFPSDSNEFKTYIQNYTSRQTDNLSFQANTCTLQEPFYELQQQNDMSLYYVAVEKPYFILHSSTYPDIFFCKNAQELTNILLNGIGNSSASYISDHQGNYIVGTVSRSQTKFIEFVHQEQLQSCLLNESIQLRKYKRQNISVYGAISALPKGCLFVEINKQDVQKSLTFYLNAVYGFILFNLIIGLGLSYFFSKKILFPLKQLIIGTQKFSKGDFNYRIQQQEFEEFNELKFSLNHLAQEVSNSQVELEMQAKHLESEVHQRTQDLQTKIEESKDANTAMINILEDLEESMKKQKRLEQIKTEFLSVTSHELRTPITPMKAQLEMLLAEFFGTITPEQTNSLNLILKNTLSLDTLITDILDISKIESGNMKFDMKQEDIVSLLHDVVDTMQTKAQEKQLQIQFNPDVDSFFAMIDYNRIRQVMLNLLSNSIKFTDPNKKITVILDRTLTTAVIRIKDEGIGIPKEDQQRIFAPFEQVDSSRSRNYEGTGLGLAISMGIIKNHNGIINVESEEGKGSEFIITLPIKQEEQTKEVELFNVEQYRTLDLFKEYLHKNGFELIKEREKEMLKEELLTSSGKLHYNLSLDILLKEGYIKKLNT